MLGFALLSEADLFETGGVLGGQTLLFNPLGTVAVAT